MYKYIALVCILPGLSTRSPPPRPQKVYIILRLHTKLRAHTATHRGSALRPGRTAERPPRLPRVLLCTRMRGKKGGNPPRKVQPAPQGGLAGAQPGVWGVPGYQRLAGRVRACGSHGLCPQRGRGHGRARRAHPSAPLSPGSVILREERKKINPN